MIFQFSTPVQTPSYESSILLEDGSSILLESVGNLLLE